MALFRKAIAKLSGGLARTRQKFASSLRAVLAGRQLDDDLLDDLEATLIQADIGVTSVRRISTG